MHFFILICLNAAKFVFPSVFTRIQTICPKIWKVRWPRMPNVYFQQCTSGWHAPLKNVLLTREHYWNYKAISVYERGLIRAREILLARCRWQALFCKENESNEVNKQTQRLIAGFKTSSARSTLMFILSFTRHFFKGIMIEEWLGDKDTKNRNKPNIDEINK